MEKIIVANHKMNLDINEINTYLKKLNAVKEKFIVCPSSIYIPYFINENFNVGIQNVYSKNKGAYTGEISPRQAKKIGVKYALIGHSERRDIFHEDNDLIKEKIQSCLDNHLKVILCVGETLEERESNLTLEVVKSELSVIDNPEDIIVAYEPTWAIGNGKNPGINEVKEVVRFIKKCYNVKVLYGGSVSFDNIKELLSIEEIDGYLIGNASTKVEEVLKILEVTNQ